MGYETLDKTESLCPVCLKKVDAEIIVKYGRILITKSCAEHGKFECLHLWDNPFLYKEFSRISKKKNEFVKDTTLDITSKCNMKCPFCFSTEKGGVYEPDIDYLIKKAKSWGEGSILLYGGEPTLRKDLFEIIKKIKDMGLDVHILTNGLKLDKDFARKLDKSGLNRVQLQFDSFDDEINQKMRKQKLINHKLRAIKSLKNTKIDLSLFVVLIKDHNENEINKIIRFAADNCDKISTVIFSPVSPEGRYNNFEIKHMTNDDIFQRIDEGFGIKKKDFVVCTEFDVNLSNFLYKIGGIKRRSPAPCEALCYIYMKESGPIPLNRMIELDKLSEIFDEIVESSTDNKPRLILSFIAKYIRKGVKIDMSSIPFLTRTSLSLASSYIAGSPVKRKFKKSFGLIINPSHNRYNIDYNFIKKCNLYSDVKDEKFMTFCEKNIVSTGPKELKMLNADMIV